MMPNTESWFEDEMRDGMPQVEPKYARSVGNLSDTSKSGTPGSDSARTPTPKSLRNTSPKTSRNSPIIISVQGPADVDSSTGTEAMIHQLHITRDATESSHDQYRPRSRSFGSSQYLIPSRHFSGIDEGESLNFHSKWNKSADMHACSSLPHSYHYWSQSVVKHQKPRVDELKRSESPHSIHSMESQRSHSPHRSHSPYGRHTPTVCGSIAEMPHIPDGSDIFQHVMLDMETDAKIEMVQHPEHSQKQLLTKDKDGFDVCSVEVVHSHRDEVCESSAHKLPVWTKVKLSADSATIIPVIKKEVKAAGNLRMYSRKYSRPSPPSSPKLGRHHPKLKSDHHRDHRRDVEDKRVHFMTSHEHPPSGSPDLYVSHRYSNMLADKSKLHEKVHSNDSVHHRTKALPGGIDRTNHGATRRENIPGYVGHPNVIKLPAEGVNRDASPIGRHHSPKHKSRSITHPQASSFNVDSVMIESTAQEKPKIQSRWHLAQSKLKEIIQKNKPNNDSSSDSSPRMTRANPWSRKRIRSPRIKNRALKKGKADADVVEVHIQENAKQWNNEDFSDVSDDEDHPTRRIRWLRRTVLSARKDRRYEPDFDLQEETRKRSILKHPVLQMEDPEMLPNVFIIKHFEDELC